MFTWYERLCALRYDLPGFAGAFAGLADELPKPVEQLPASCTKLIGHVAHDSVTPVWRRLRAHFSHPGLYIWGAWSGDAMHIQYVGIAGKNEQSTLGKRFGERYRSELSMVRLHDAHLRSLPETFRGRDRTAAEREADALKYAAIGLVVPPKQDSRPPRTERYAKVGLDNLWYYVLPASREMLNETVHGENVGRRFLAETEARLNQCASAWQFDVFRRDDVWGFPLLNRENLQPDFVSGCRDSIEIRGVA